LYFIPRSSSTSSLISFLSKYKEIVAKDTQTNINIPLVNDVNKIIASIDEAYSSGTLQVLQELEYCAIILGIDVYNINLEDVLFQLSDEYYDDYDKWSKIGMILCNISTKENEDMKKTAHFDNSVNVKPTN
jgi:hypothetical protein